LFCLLFAHTYIYGHKYIYTPGTDRPVVLSRKLIVIQHNGERPIDEQLTFDLIQIKETNIKINGQSVPVHVFSFSKKMSHLIIPKAIPSPLYTILFIVAYTVKVPVFCEITSMYICICFYYMIYIYIYIY
jgi:hypothetical protein